MEKIEESGNVIILEGEQSLHNSIIMEDDMLEIIRNTLNNEIALNKKRKIN